MHNKDKFISIAVFAFLCMIWSSTWVVIKIGLETVPPFLSAGLRFLLAGTVLFIFRKLNKHKMKYTRKDHRFFALFGLINFTGGYAFVYWGEQYINSGLTSVLFAVMPFYVVFLAARMLPDEKISLTKLIGIVIGFSGVVIIFYDQIHITDSMGLLGMIMVLFAPLFSSVGTIIARKKSKILGPFDLNTMPILYSALSFFILFLIFELNSPAVFNAKTIFSISYLAIFGTAIAFALYFWMLRNTSAVIMSTITFITPPLALIWGYVILAEQVTNHLILGMILIFAGIATIRK